MSPNLGGFSVETIYKGTRQATVYLMSMFLQDAYVT